MYIFGSFANSLAFVMNLGENVNNFQPNIKEQTNLT